MSGIGYFRSKEPPYWELKTCQNVSHAEKAHYHEEWALGLVTSGRTEVDLSGAAFTVAAPTVVVFRPGTVHACRPDLVSPWGFQMLFWPGELPVVGEADFLLSPGKDALFQRTESFFEALRTQCPSRAQSLSEIQGLVQHLLTAPRAVRWSHPRPWSPLEDRLCTDFSQPMPLESLANDLGTDKSILIRQFKKARGLPPAQFRQVGRINLVKKFLQEGFDLTDAALKAGFYDLSHLTRNFRRFTGVSPARYQNPGRSAVPVNFVQDEPPQNR